MNDELLSQKSLIEESLAGRPRLLSSRSFSNVFLWKDFFRFDLKMIEGCLCLFASDKVGCFQYLPSLGPGISPTVADQCFAHMAAENHGNGVSRIENVQVNELAFFPESQFSYYLKGYEYLYFRPDIVSLQGNDFKSKRNAINALLRQHAPQVLPFTPEMTAECLELYVRWAAQRRESSRDEIYLQMLEENQGIHRLGMEHFQELGLIGRVVVIDGKIKAYTFGYPLSQNIFCVLFEVADLSCQGLAVYIFHEFCQDPNVANFNFINAMDDFGLKNIEQTKLSFRPAMLVPAYTVTKK